MLKVEWDSIDDGDTTVWASACTFVYADREVQRRADPKVQRSQPPIRYSQGRPRP
jgi:hypothetical protein